ncbi:MAG: hypothetical protein KJ737_12990 [Proteobacteria bacterium]|nr:hypothetical protein [Pseudomonadota bacterium]
MKAGYKRAIEILVEKYEELKANHGDPEEIQSIREGIERLCYPFREDLTEDVRSPLQDSDDWLTFDKKNWSIQEKEEVFWKKIAEKSQRNLDAALHTLEILKKL